MGEENLLAPDEMTPEPIILPPLPNELALLCLARLPRCQHPLGRCVSRAWRLALHPSSIDPVRRRLGITDECVCVCLSAGEPDLTSITYAWLLLDPRFLTCNVIPPPPVHTYVMPGRFFEATGVQGIAAGNDLLVAGIDISNNWFEPPHESKIFRFDAVSGQWRLLAATPPPMDADRRWFASGMLDDFVYVAGGHVACRNPFKHLRSAERFHSRTREREMLPDMNEVRDHCSGFIMDGCFYVIGGFSHYDTSGHNSGEFFDPRTGVWTLVPNMWPKEMAATVPECSAAPNVAIVNGELYALRTYSREIMRYEKLNNSWVTMGCFPGAETWRCDSSSCDDRMIGVGEELWVFQSDGECDISIVAGKPKAGLLSDSLTWRPLPFKLEGGFTKVSTCVVLKE